MLLFWNSAPQESKLSAQEEKKNVSFRESLFMGLKRRSVVVVVGVLFPWAQQKLAPVIGSPVGDEQRIAFETAKSIVATVVFWGHITMQRIIERLSFFHKLQLISAILWDAFSTSANRMANYVKNADSNVTFLQGEIYEFYKFNPDLAEIVVQDP